MFSITLRLPLVNFLLVTRHYPLHACARGLLRCSPHTNAPATVTLPPLPTPRLLTPAHPLPAVLDMRHRFPSFGQQHCPCAASTCKDHGSDSSHDQGVQPDRKVPQQA